MNAPAPAKPVNPLEPLLGVLIGMSHSELKNYVTPGLSSLLLGGPGRGQFRLFDATRTTHEFITPHSHRFDFAALVLQGSVINTTFVELDSSADPDTGDRFLETRICWTGRHGSYEPGPRREARFADFSTRYDAGQAYMLASNEVHSIKFRRGTIVLFIEGPPVAGSEWTRILEPIAYGKPLPTFKVEPWMFEPFGPRAEPVAAPAPKPKRQRRRRVTVTPAPPPDDRVTTPEDHRDAA